MGGFLASVPSRLTWFGVRPIEDLGSGVRWSWHLGFEKSSSFPTMAVLCFSQPSFGVGEIDFGHLSSGFRHSINQVLTFHHANFGVHVFMFLIQTLSFDICTFSIEMTRIGHSRVPPLWFYYPALHVQLSTFEWVSSNLLNTALFLTQFPRKVVSPLHKFTSFLFSLTG